MDLRRAREEEAHCKRAKVAVGKVLVGGRNLDRSARSVCSSVKAGEGGGGGGERGREEEGEG